MIYSSQLALADFLCILLLFGQKNWSVTGLKSTYNLGVLAFLFLLQTAGVSQERGERVEGRQAANRRVWKPNQGHCGKKSVLVNGAPALRRPG